MSTLTRTLFSLSLLALLGSPLVVAPAGAQTNFGSVDVGSSATETVTVTIPSAATFTAIKVVTMGAPGLDFTPTGTGTCAIDVAYAAAQTCTVGVTFKPLYAGQRKGAVILSNSGKNVYVRAFVQGTGNAPQVAFVQGSVTAFSPTLDGYPLTVSSDAVRTGIAVDGAGTVYISAAVTGPTGMGTTGDIAAYGVLEIPAGSTTATLLIGATGSVRVDGAGNRILNDLLIPQGTTAYTDYSHGETVAPAVDGAGNLFLSTSSPENGHDFRIYEYLNEVHHDIERVTGPSNYYDLCAKVSQALDPAGNLFISSCASVYELYASQIVAGGANTSANVITPVVDGKPLNYAADLAFDGVGNLFIVDVFFNRIVELPVNGGAPFAIDPVVDGKGLYFPTALAFDVAGNLYILDSGNQRVVEIHSSQPPTLTFQAGGVGSTSRDSPQTVAVQNVGTLPLIFSSLTFPPDFPEQSGGANPCTASTSLNPGQTCNLNIDFAPQTDTRLSEAIELKDNSLNQGGAAQSIGLIGNYIAAALSSSSLSYGPQQVGTQSPSQQITLTNALITPLDLVGIKVTGADASSFDFGSDCPMVLAPQATCTIHGHFIPQAAGPLSATLLIQHHDAGPSQLVALTGTGLTPPAPTLSATSLDFGTQAVGTSSASQAVTLTNTGQLAFTIDGITTTGSNASSFLFASDCPGNLFAGQTCTIHGHFTPTAPGPLTATITLHNTAPGPFPTITLTGTGK